MYEYTAPKTKPLGTGGDMHFAFSYATQAALVEVDLETGEVHVHQSGVRARHRARDQPAHAARADRGRDRDGAGQLPDRSIHPRKRRAVVTPAVALQDARASTTRRRSSRIWSSTHRRRAVRGERRRRDRASITPAIISAIANAVGVRIFRLPVDQDSLLRAIKSGATSVD